MDKNGSKERLLIVHLIGLSIAIIYILILLSTAKDIGFARDEGFYFTSSESYARWFQLLIEKPREAVKRGAIDAHWSINSEHPSLMKSLFGISWLIFHKKLHLMRESTSFRFPGMLMSGLLLYLVVVFAAQLWGLRVGVFSALLLATMPRYFYHSHLDCFDVPIATMWFATVFAFYKSLSSVKWAVLTGIIWGLALETKLNAFFIPVVLFIFWFFRFGRRFFLCGVSGKGGKGGLLGIPPLPLAFFFMVILGLPLFVALWPYLWYDTINRLNNYLGFHLHHPYYNIEYFGITYFKPPFPISYPFVMTIITMPLSTIMLSFVGMGYRLKMAILRWMGRSWQFDTETAKIEEKNKGATLLILLNMLFPMCLIALPSTPIFGGTKHWLPSWPFIAIFAGIGFKQVVDSVFNLMEFLKGRQFEWKWATEVVIVSSGLLFLSATAQQTEVSHPFGLSHYTMAIGETPGSADAGMCRQFWGFTTGSALDWLNANVPPRGRVFFHDTAWDSYNMYKRDGTLRSDIQWSGDIEGADVAMVHWEQHMSGYEYEIWTWMGTIKPAEVITHQGVTILPIYKK